MGAAMIHAIETIKRWLSSETTEILADVLACVGLFATCGILLVIFTA